MFVVKVEGLVRRGCNPGSSVLPKNDFSVLSRLCPVEDELERMYKMNTHPLSLPPSRIPYSNVMSRHEVMKKKHFFFLLCML